MTADQPIACTLTPAELPERLMEIRAIGDTSLRSIAEGKSRARLRFAADPGTSERLKKVVSAEARCCAFLELDLTEAPDELVLTISSPVGGETVMHELVTAFRPSRRVSA